MENLHHFAAHIDGSQVPQEKEPAHPISLVYNFCVGLPVQSVVTVDAQVLGTPPH